MTIIRNTKHINGNEVTLYIEVDETPEQAESIYSDLRESRAEKVARQIVNVTQDLFGEGMDLICNCAICIVDGIERMNKEVRPSEFEVQFAVKLGAEVGAAIVKTNADAQMQVTMRWNKP